MEKKKETKEDSELYFKDKLGGVHYNEPVPMPWARAAFPNLVEPVDPFNTGKLSYGVNLLIPKDPSMYPKQCSDIEKFKDAHKYLKDMEALFKKIYLKAEGKPLTTTAFKDGDLKDYDGFKGHWYLRANRKPEQSFNMKVGQLVESVTSGIWVRALVYPGYSKQTGFFLKLASLNIVHDDGVRFTSGPNLAPMLDDLDAEVEKAAAANVVSDMNIT